MDSSKPVEFTINIEGDVFSIKNNGGQNFSVTNNSENFYEISLTNPQGGGGQTATLQPQIGVMNINAAHPTNQNGFQISVKNLGCEEPGKK